MSELLPCPFCGGKAKTIGSVLDGFFVYCPSCGAGSVRKQEKGYAIEAWNTRAERTCRNVPQEDGSWFKCSECGFWIDWYCGDTNEDENMNYCPNCGAKVMDE